MIKCEKTQIQMTGSAQDLMAETTMIIKTLLQDIPREIFVPMVVSSIYLCPSPDEDPEVDVKKATEDFRKDVELTLGIFKGYNECPGKDIDEKLKNAREGKF